MKYDLRAPRLSLGTKIGAFRHVGDAAALPLTFDPRVNYGARPLPGVEDQRSTSMCEAMSFSFALWNAVGFQGRQPSHRALYWMALAYERRWAGQPLVDAGTNDYDMLSSIMLSGSPTADAHVFGIVPMTVWPDDFDGATEELPPDVVQSAIPIQPGDVALILSSGADRISDLQRSISGGGPSLQYAVPFTTAVDDSYMSLGPNDVWRGPTGPIRGLHKTCAVGWAPDPASGDGLPRVLVRGSWGTDYGDKGYIWVAGATIASAVCSDFLVVRGGVIL
jgi:hypothetical protein